MNKKYKFIQDKKIVISKVFLEEILNDKHFLERWFKEPLPIKLHQQLIRYIKRNSSSVSTVSLNNHIQSLITRFKATLKTQGRHRKLKKLELREIPYRIIKQPERKKDSISIDDSISVGIGNTGMDDFFVPEPEEWDWDSGAQGETGASETEYDRVERPNKWWKSDNKIFKTSRSFRNQKR